MKEKLISTVNEVIALLTLCGQKKRADWFTQRLEIIRSEATSPNTVKETVKDIRGVIAGVGSFSDLPLVPKEGSNMTVEMVRELQWKLVDELDEATKNC